MTKRELVKNVQVLSQLPDELAEKVTDTVLATLCGRLGQGEVKRLNQFIPEDVLTACLHSRPEATENLFELDQFLYNLRAEHALDPDTAEAAMVATFRTLREALPEEEVKEVAEHLPKHLKVVWLEA